MVNGANENGNGWARRIVAATAVAAAGSAIFQPAGVTQSPETPSTVTSVNPQDRATLPIQRPCPAVSRYYSTRFSGLPETTISGGTMTGADMDKLRQEDYQKVMTPDPFVQQAVSRAPRILSHQNTGTSASTMSATWTDENGFTQTKTMNCPAGQTCVLTVPASASNVKTAILNAGWNGPIRRNLRGDCTFGLRVRGGFVEDISNPPSADALHTVLDDLGGLTGINATPLTPDSAYELYKVYEQLLQSFSEADWSRYGNIINGMAHAANEAWSQMSYWARFTHQFWG